MSLEQAIAGETGGMDETGLISHRQPFCVDSFREIFTTAPPILDLSGIRLGFRRIESYSRRRSGQKWNFTALYEGRAPVELEGEEWDVDAEFSQEPIESHRRIKQIVEYYGGFTDPADGRIKFPEEMPRNQRSSGLSGRSSGTPNPMHGTDIYFKPGAVATLLQVVDDVPNDIYQEYEKIVERPLIRALAGVDFGERNWLQSIPLLSGRGTATEIRWRWTLSEDGGWPPVTYGLIDDF